MNLWQLIQKHKCNFNAYVWSIKKLEVMRKALSFEILIVSDFIIGIACGFTLKMRSEHRDVASNVAFFMLEAVGIVSTVLSLRSAGIVFGDAEIRHSFCVQPVSYTHLTLPTILLV